MGRALPHARRPGPARPAHRRPGAFAVQRLQSRRLSQSALSRPQRPWPWAEHLMRAAAQNNQLIKDLGHATETLPARGCSLRFYREPSMRRPGSRLCLDRWCQFRHHARRRLRAYLNTCIWLSRRSVICRSRNWSFTMRFFILALVLSIVPATLAQPIYRWIDENGVANYTNDESKVPAGVKAETTVGDEITVVASSRAASSQGTATAPVSLSTDI